MRKSFKPSNKTTFKFRKEENLVNKNDVFLSTIRPRWLLMVNQECMPSQKQFLCL